LLSKSQKYFYDNDAIKEPAIYAGDDRGSRNDSRRGTEANSMSGKTGEFRNKRSVWTVNTKPYSGAHFAVFPEELIEPCILAGSRVGDVVLDPFLGSGTTLKVSQCMKRKGIGFEINEDFVPLIEKRINEYWELPDWKSLDILHSATMTTGNKAPRKAQFADKKKDKDQVDMDLDD
jgi:DNA modification methylase